MSQHDHVTVCSVCGSPCCEHLGNQPPRLDDDVREWRGLPGGGQMSAKTLLDRLGIDYEEEVRRLREELEATRPDELPVDEFPMDEFPIPARTEIVVLGPDEPRPLRPMFYWPMDMVMTEPADKVAMARATPSKGAWVLTCDEGDEDYCEELYGEDLRRIPVFDDTDYMQVSADTVAIYKLDDVASGYGGPEPLAEFRLLGAYDFDDRGQMNQWLAAKAKGSVPEWLEKKRVP